MYLQNLMKFHQWIPQDIKETKCYGHMHTHTHTHTQTHGRKDGQRENSIPTHKHSFAGGINRICKKPKYGTIFGDDVVM